MGKVFQPTRKCRRCNGKGCERCQDGRRPIEVWHIQYSHRGKQFRESSKSRKRSVAVRLLKKRLAEIGAGDEFVGPKAERTTFEELAQMVLDDYAVNGRKSIRRTRIAVARLKEFFAGYKAVDITTDRIRAYMNVRFQDGMSNSTVRNEVNVLRRGFRLAAEARKVIAVPHFPKIDVSNVRTGFFEDNEFRKVVKHLPAAIEPLAEFGYLTGWRHGEILPMRWSQVDFKAGVVRLEVGTTKNNEGRVLPFRVLPALRELLERQRRHTTELEQKLGRVIPFVWHRNGREIKTFERSWKIACEDAGCPERLFHDLRRTAVRNLERAGVPRSIAMKITGHKSESVYRRYAIVNEADVAEGLEKLGRYLGGGPEAKTH